jgi:hypothetical protein
MPAVRWPLFPSPRMLFIRRAMVEGLRGENKVWRLIMLLIIANRLLRRIMGSDPQTVAIEKIGPGETVILRAVTSLATPTKKK